MTTHTSSSWWGSSDLIAAGYVLEVRESTFVLLTEEVLGGPYQVQVEIDKFHDWACSQRWTPKYEVGQKLLVFLDEQDGKYRRRSAGIEGELPILDGQVYCHLPDLALRFPKLGLDGMNRVPYKSMRAAILGYRNCYRLVSAPNPVRTIGRLYRRFPFDHIEQICSNRQLEQYAEQSTAHRSLVKETQWEIQQIREWPERAELAARRAWRSSPEGIRYLRSAAAIADDLPRTVAEQRVVRIQRMRVSGMLSEPRPRTVRPVAARETSP